MLVLWATQIRKLGFRQNKNHIMEIQVNGGDVDAKIKWVHEHFEGRVGDHGNGELLIIGLKLSQSTT